MSLRLPMHVFMTELMFASDLFSLMRQFKNHRKTCTFDGSVQGSAFRHFKLELNRISVSTDDIVVVKYNDRDTVKMLNLKP